MKAVLALPHSVVQKKIEAHRKEAALSPNRRGPKRESKRTAKMNAVKMSTEAE
jgi:hypothetical protein